MSVKNTCLFCGKQLTAKQRKYCSNKCQEHNYNKLKKEEHKKWYLDNKDRLLEKQKKYYSINKDIINKKRKVYEKNKLVTDEFYRFKYTIRRLVRNSFIRKNCTKSIKTTKILGCSLDEFRQYIEKQLPENKTLKDLGLHGFHIDHIIPLKVAKTEEDVVKLCHYTNLRPLWCTNNWSKSGKLDYYL